MKYKYHLLSLNDNRFFNIISISTLSLFLSISTSLTLSLLLLYHLQCLVQHSTRNDIVEGRQLRESLQVILDKLSMNYPDFQGSKTSLYRQVEL